VTESKERLGENARQEREGLRAEGGYGEDEVKRKEGFEL